MIDKIKGKYRLICDEAAEEVFSTFDEAVKLLKDLPVWSNLRGLARFIQINAKANLLDAIEDYANRGGSVSLKHAGVGTWSCALGSGNSWGASSPEEAIQKALEHVPEEEEKAKKLPSVADITGICKDVKMYSREEDYMYERIGRAVEDWLISAELRVVATGFGLLTAKGVLKELARVIEEAKAGTYL